jgi:magnesium transporter
VGSDQQIVVGGDELVAHWRNNSSAKVRIDIEIDNKAKVSELLESLACHVLVIQDALRTRHPPKIEFFANHIFILYRGIAVAGDDLEFRRQQIVFLLAIGF